MLRRLLCSLSCFVLLSFSAPDTPARDDAAPSSEAGATAAQRELVQQLGHPSYDARERAEDQLASLGLAAEAVLTEALTNPDAEIRRRARNILNRLRTDTPAPSGSPRPNQVEATAAQRLLVQQLGDPSYHARERAERELVNQGLAAEAALLEALKVPDVEIRLRASGILNQVREKAFEARLAAFIADVDGSRQLGLPGWERFRDLVGDRPRTREMFAEMTRAEGPLLSAYEKQDPEMPLLFEHCSAWLQSQANSGNADSGIIPPPSLATLLLIGSDYSQGISHLYSLLSQQAAMLAIGTDARQSVLRTLLEHCVASSTSSFGMMLAQKYGLEKTGLQQATKLIEGNTTSSSSLHHAIINVGRFGGEEHIGLLTPLLDNKTVCHRWSNQALKKEGTINVEVRDAALVVLLHLTGKDPKEHGFKLLKENPETLYYVYTFGFLEDEEREAVHAKWNPLFR